MKKRALSILLACVFLLSVFMFCTTAFAAENSADGLTAVLDTDKDAYVAGDTINVALEVTNTGNLAHNVQTELIIPEGVTLVEGQLKSEAAPLAGNESVKFGYVLEVPSVEVPTTAAPTTQAPTTQPGGGEDTAPETRDLAAVIYGTLAIASLAGLIALTFGSKMLKQRWFVLILCGALLLGVAAPMAASAADAGYSFEVVEAITIDGAAAEVKAIVTYDLDIGEVAFKQGGTYLWAKEVEQGYYLPSDVTYDGKTTSKDGAYRPEVNAPYIDMLFGTAKKAGEFTKDIFNADAEQTVLIGLTDDPASKAALQLIDEDEWIIAVIDGKLVVTGWYDNATVAAARALYELAAVDAADVTLNLPIVGKVDYVDVDMPAVTFGNFVGGMDSDFGAVVLRWNEVVADDFDTYCAALEAAGYELYESNTMDGFKKTKTLEFATYVKGDDAILVQYLPVSLLDQDPATLTSAELKAFQAAFSADGDAIRLILTSTDLLSNNDAANEGWTDAGITPKVHLANLYDGYGDGNNIGQCQIFTLADGSFIVVDGGYSTDAENLYRTLSYKNERKDGKIVVAAWFLTHAHSDHTGALGALAASEWADEITVEQMILNPVAKSYRWRTEYDPYGYSAGFSAEFDNIKTVTAKFAQGEDYKLVIPHMGQIMKIRNAEVEMLTVGDEDMFPVIFNNDNAQSMVFRVTFDGIDQEIMILGDSALDQTYNVYFPLLCGELHADILQVAHHGLGGQTSRFYPMFTDVEVAIWPTDWHTINKNNLMNGSTNGGLRNFDPLDIVCEEYVQTLNIPFSKAEDAIVKTKLWTYKAGKYDALEMNVSYVPAFRFQNTFTATGKKTEILAELETYDADILVVTQIAQLAKMYKDIDMVGELQEELGYPYSYYTPAWGCDAENDMETGAFGTMGHLVLSRYPITEAETITLLEGTPYNASGYTEGRAAAHVVLDVEGMVVDVYASHFETNSWNAFKAALATEEYAPVGQNWIICANNKKFASSGAAMGLNDAVAVGFADGDYEVYVSSGTTVVEKETHTEWKTITGNQYMGNSYSYVAELPRYVIQKGETDTDPNTLVVGTMGVARMGNWNESYVEHLAALVSEHVPDVLCLQSISQNASGPYGGYGDKDLVGMLQNLLGYQYVAYTPAWYCDTDYNLETGDGTHGNMILSRYPVEYIETINVQEGAIGATPEGRTVGHVLVDVEGVKVDVYYTEFEGSKVDANLAAFAEKYAPKTDKVIIAGILRSSDLAKFETALKQELEIAVEGHDYENILISDNLALSDSKVESGVGNMDSFIVTKVYLDGNGIPEYVLTVNNGTGSGKYQAGTSVTVTAKAPSRIEVFTGWTVEKGNVTIADPTLEEITIVMPAEEVVLTANYAKKEVEREPTGENVDLNVAMVPAFRFANSYKANAESIHKALLDLGADVLVITQIDKNCTTSYNAMDVPGAIAEALKDVYPYSYWVDAWEVNGGANGHLLLSKYEIKETEKIVLKEGTPDNSSDEGRAFGRAMLDVKGTTVDVFFGWMSDNYWTTFAPYIKASEADIWIATGHLRYANPEKSGIEEILGETISCAFNAWNEGGNTHWCNIISSNNCAMSNVKREVCNDRFGANADPLYSATVTMPLYQDKVEETALNVALVPAFRFANEYVANSESIHKALLDLGADVLAICQIDKNSDKYNNYDVPGSIAEALKEVYPYSYWIDVWEFGTGTTGHLLLSKYEILETEKIVLNAGEANNTSNEGRAYGRAMLDVNGATVDVFFGWMSSNYWSTFGPIVGASKADAWVVTGHMAYASPEFSGIQAAIGEPISAAFEHYNIDGVPGTYHMCNIISSGNGTFSNAKREACTDRFGKNADPLYQANITFTFA